MSNFEITSFNNGEVTPHIDARSDVEKYSSSCRILDNMLPLVYGGVTRRPGTKYSATTKTEGSPVRLIPFIYSSDIAYMVEFGDQYARFYYGGEALVDGNGVPIELETPYLSADLPQLQYRQIADTMWLIHPDYAPRKLTRSTVYSFALDAITFTNGPFLTRNDLDAADGVTMTCNATTVGSTGALTASAATFTAGHVGALFKLTHPRVNTVVSLVKTTTATGASSALDVKGTFTFNTHGLWNATVLLERNENSAGWETYRTFIGTSDRNIQLTGTEKSDNVQYRINVTVHAVSSTFNADLTVNNPTQDGIVRIDSITSATVATVTVIAALASTDATLRWAEGAWSAERGYPGAFAFHEDRSVYAATDHDPATVWFSETGDYENFEEGTEDADSFSLVLTTTNRIRWIESLDVLAVGTTGDEWVLMSNKPGTPITPTNFAARWQSTHGSAAIQPVRVRNAVLFVDYVGRKVREMTYSVQEDRYVSPDLTALAEHMTISGIVGMSYQHNPDSILWCVLDDGTLVSLTYEREQNVVAWARHTLGGPGLADSVACIPGSTEDEVWLAVNRTIGIHSVRFVEQMQPRLVSEQEDSFFVDAGIIYDGAATATISGLSHLKGMTVAVLGDGADFGTKQVVGGSVTIANSVSKAIIGLPYTFRLKPMRMDTRTQSGATHGKPKKISELVVSFYQTLNARYGTSLSASYDIPWRTTEDYTAPPALFTGDRTVVLDGGFDPDDPILINGSSPFPCTVRAILASTEYTGR